MKNLTTTNNSYNNQQAHNYIFYMILTSYFEKAICKNKVLEQKLFLFYKELRLDAQYRMEAACIKKIESKVLPQLPKAFLDSEVEVHMVRRKEDGILAMRIDSGLERLWITAR